MQGPPRITGTLVRQHVLQLSRVLGAPLVDQAIAALAPEDARAIREASPLGWVPVRAIENLYVETAARAGTDVSTLHWKIGRVCTADTFRTLWRMLLRFTSDEALVSRTPVIYSKTYDSGRIETFAQSPGHARIVLSGWPEVPPFVRRGLCIGISTVLELAGRRDVQLRDEGTRDGAVFHARWAP